MIAGVYSRPIALVLIAVLAGAIQVHWPNGWSFTANGGGWEYVGFLIAALGVQALLGDGAFALSRAAREWPGLKLSKSRPDCPPAAA